MKKVLKIKGMHCSSCEILLREAIEEKGIGVISASHSKGEIVVEMKNDSQMKAIQAAVEKEGYSLA